MKQLLAIALALPLAGCITAEEAAKQDDAYCRSIGATGPAYTQCRMFTTVRRDRQREQAAQAFQEGMADVARGLSNRPSVTCRTYGNTTTCN